MSVSASVVNKYIHIEDMAQARRFSQNSNFCIQKLQIIKIKSLVNECFRRKLKFIF